MTPAQQNTASAVRTIACIALCKPLRDVGSDVAHLSLTAWVKAGMVACFPVQVPASLNLPAARRLTVESERALFSWPRHALTQSIETAAACLSVISLDALPNAPTFERGGPLKEVTT